MNQLFAQGAVPIDVVRLLLDSLLCVLASFVLIWHYERYSHVISNRSYFSRIFPTIMLTTLLIIAVVKSSLALSLGLIGALSIVRFRAPIKEPEELAYLFLAIGIGLGLGSGNTVATLIVATLILLVIGFYSRRKEISEYSRSSLSITVEKQQEIDEITSLVKTAFSAWGEEIQLKRVEVDDEMVELIFYVDFQGQTAAFELIERLRKALPDARVVLLDRAEF